jgi:hypothetical protein
MAENKALATRRAILNSDTTRDMERRQVALWRAMTPARKMTAAAGASMAVQRLSLAGSRQRFPDEREPVLLLRLAALKLGSAVAKAAYGEHRHPILSSVDRMNPIDVALAVARALEQCRLRYVVGGSLASSMSGEPRSTLDVDLMVDIGERDVPCVLEQLGGDFHADADALVRAVRERTSANVIHLPSATKVDLFVMGASPIDARQMDRRRKVRVSAGPGGELYVYTPEDILLQKLRWFRLGREVSERQWRDILGIIIVQADALDREYVETGAAQLGVGDLLKRALDETA